ncbi:MAG: threonine synthase [Verrucomicrobiota bacterium]|nr:threonine synthase [Verrucomicrobiota bacterium]
MNFVTHLECADCARRYPSGQPHNLCTDCHRPLWVRYDLDRVREQFPVESLAGRPGDLWRYRELLPYADADNIVSLGETATPILTAARLGAELGMTHLQIKDESRLPTGSFKARGMAMAITMANEFGLRRVACPTAGNAGGAMAAYASRAGMESFVFMPDDTPMINLKETHLAGAQVFRVNGLINDCGRLVGEGREPMGWFDLSTLKEPYRIEGKKTMGLELAEQLGWELPDVILYPTGGGTGLIGMWKAFAELEAIGWLPSGKRPRMIACQSEGCAPIVRAFEAGEKHAPPFENAHTVASGLRVPVAVGDFMILNAVRESGGCAVTAPESCISVWMERLAKLEGLAICPETAICMGALDQLLAGGAIRPSESVLVFNTGGAMKYPDLIEEPVRHIDLGQAPDWQAIAEG